MRSESTGTEMTESEFMAFLTQSPYVVGPITIVSVIFLLFVVYVVLMLFAKLASIIKNYLYPPTPACVHCGYVAGMESPLYEVGQLA